VRRTHRGERTPPTLNDKTKGHNPYLDEAQGIYDKAETGGRELTPKELGRIAERTGKAREVNDKQLRADVFGEDGPTKVIAGDGSQGAHGSPGERFVVRAPRHAGPQGGPRGAEGADPGRRARALGH
jgi:hypothetical protein